MKLHLLITCATAVLVVACSNKSKTDDTETPGQDSLQTDSVIAEQPKSELQIEVIHFRDSVKIAKEYSIYDVKLRIPAAGSVVGDSIRRHICQLLNYDVTMDMRKVFAKAAKRYFSKQREEITEDDEWAREHPWEIDYEINIDTITPHYVSLIFSGYDYRGGAHGMPWNYGITFMKSNGHTMTWNDFFTNKELVRPFISEYLDQDIIENVAEYCNLPEDSDPPAPSLDPWLHGDTVVINYTAYEIGPYAIGMPSAYIPAKKAKRILKQKVMSLLED